MSSASVMTCLNGFISEKVSNKGVSVSKGSNDGNFKFDLDLQVAGPVDF